MFGKTKTGILIALMLVMSVLAGVATVTAATTFYTLNVNFVESGTNTPVSVSADVYDPAGKLVGHTEKMASASFSLASTDVNDPLDAYKIVATATGYESKTQYTPLEKDMTINMHLTKAASTGGSTGSTGGSTDNTSGTNNTSTDVYVKHLSFDDRVAPGDKVDFKVTVKNGASYNADNVKVTVTINGIDDGDAIDAESDTFTLDSKDDVDQTVSLTMPLAAKEKSYAVDVKVEWENQDGKDISSVKTDSIKIEKADHDVRISDVQLDSDATQAGANGQIAVTVQNVGSNDETVRFQVKSDQLGINVMSAQFSLKEGKESTQQVPFTVSDTAKPGKYYVYVTAFYGSTQVQDFVTLEVKAPSTATTTPSGPVTVTPVTVTTAPDNGNSGASGGLAGLVIAALVLIAVVGMLLKDVMPEMTVAKPQIIKASKR